MNVSSEIALVDAMGRRKYLSESEVLRFLEAASEAEIATRLFCCLLVFTGCRISEALAITPARLDAETNHVVFRTLKRRQVTYRLVPIPAELMEALRLYARKLAETAPLWNCSRTTAWSRVKTVMRRAGIVGAHASPKALRHSFGIAGAEENVPMPVMQRWLGHAKLETTAIYQQAVGREERAFAARLWERWQRPVS